MGIVLTLGGTGSDMNWLAGVNYEEKHEKVTFAGKHAVFNIIDPAYTVSVPTKQLLTGAFDTLSHYMETYFGKGSFVSDEIMEAIMRNVIRNARTIKNDPKNMDARSELLWDSSLALSGLPGAGKMSDFQCHSIEHWISGYTDANHGRTLAVLHPVVYRYICSEAPEKFARFATEVMGVGTAGRSPLETALAGIDALELFIRELGLPTNFTELGIDVDDAMLETIADQCRPNPGCCRQLTREDFLTILKTCAGR
jgi:alcohol dehydrogenase YqhD (iron-dependent ADH family)